MILESQKKGLLVSPLKKSIVEEVAGSLSQYIPSAKRNVPFTKIMEETKKAAAKKLARTL